MMMRKYIAANSLITVKLAFSLLQYLLQFPLHSFLPIPYHLTIRTLSNLLVVNFFSKEAKEWKESAKMMRLSWAKRPLPQKRRNWKWKKHEALRFWYGWATKINGKDVQIFLYYSRQLLNVKGNVKLRATLPYNFNKLWKIEHTNDLSEVDSINYK